jgi:pimeloyl-ACP methyl ester carboxylesterase
MMGILPNPETVEVETADGVVLRCRRYARPGARAFVCGHGQASCGYEFDLPLQGFQLSETLYRLGYEVWIMNFRGAGHPPWRSGDGGWNHSGDELGALDLPAVIDRAVAETGRPVFYIGHSYGGMALYAYLQGAVIDPDTREVTRDESVARERNSKVAGAITAGSPVAMADDAPDWMEKLRTHRWTQAVMRRLQSMLLKLSKKHRVLPVGRFALEFGFRHPLLARLIMSSPFVKTYLRPEKMGPEACRLFGTWAAGDVTLLHMAQTVQTIRKGELTTVEFPGRETYRYFEGMASITAPLAAAAGEKDFMRPVDIREKVLGAVSSERTLFLPIKGCGHVDMLYHLPLGEIAGWLEWAAT